MLFVTVKRKGIATTLLKQAITKIRTENPALEQIIVHSSPYALPIYQKMGFEVTGERITENGITYIPMKLEIADKDA
jgi:predicted GNAT family N-acyltransferase